MSDWARRAPMLLRRHRGWTIAGIVGVLVVLWLVTRSVLGSIVLLLVLAALLVVAVIIARRLGGGSAGQEAQRFGSPPPRDAQDLWQSALRHLPDVFTTGPDRTLTAPDLVELRMNKGDLDALARALDPQFVINSSSDAYRARIAEHGARVAGNGQPRVSVVSDPDMPLGRYALRPRASDPLPGPAPGAAGHDPAADVGDARTVAHDQLTSAQEPLTVAEKLPVPPLRLLSGGAVSETRTSGARAGRGGDVELRLPDVPTVSRVHAEFTYSDGHWWVTNQGRNGLMLNGTPLTGQRPVSDGDVIQWGNRPDALTSRVQVGQQSSGQS
jgi:FHA domain